MKNCEYRLHRWCIANLFVDVKNELAKCWKQVAHVWCLIVALNDGYNVKRNHEILRETNLFVRRSIHDDWVNERANWQVLQELAWIRRRQVNNTVFFSILEVLKFNAINKSNRLVLLQFNVAQPREHFIHNFSGISILRQNQRLKHRRYVFGLCLKRCWRLIEDALPVFVDSLPK